MKTPLEEATDRAMLMATYLFPYSGEPMVEWFAKLTSENRFWAYHVAHEMTKTRFTGPPIDSEDRVHEVALYFFRERSRLEDEVCKLVAPEDVPVLLRAIED
jgi:hypothetical protein